MDQETSLASMAEELERLSRRLTEVARLAHDIEDRTHLHAKIAPASPYSVHMAAIVKNLEEKQGELRNARQMAQQAFTAADQQANQLMNIMSAIVKIMNEMRSGTDRGLE